MSLRDVWPKKGVNIKIREYLTLIDPDKNHIEFLRAKPLRKNSISTIQK